MDAGPGFTTLITQNTSLVSEVTLTTPDYTGAKLISDGLMPACSALRKADPTVAAVKVAVPGFEDYYWEGHATREHLEVAAARERSGTHNW